MAVANAQTERMKANASAETEQYKAESARMKDRFEHARLVMAAECDCRYKLVLLAVGALLVLLMLPRITNLSFFGVLVELKPAPPPPPPPAAAAGVLDGTDRPAPPLTLTHSTARRGWRRWFVVQLEGPVSTVSQVKYYLHPDYEERIRTVSEPPFTLEIRALGRFLLYADVTLTDGKIIRLQRYLDA